MTCMDPMAAMTKTGGELAGGMDIRLNARDSVVWFYRKRK